MTDTLQAGDKVVLRFTDGSIRLAIITQTPRGEGDLWQFEDSYNHKIFAQNPYARTLECIERQEAVK